MRHSGLSSYSTSAILTWPSFRNLALSQEAIPLHPWERTDGAAVGLPQSGFLHPIVRCW